MKRPRMIDERAATAPERVKTSLGHLFKVGAATIAEASGKLGLSYLRRKVFGGAILLQCRFNKSED